MSEEVTADRPVDLGDSTYYLNRELSELAFQQRVLHEGLDERNPLLERVRFLAYFTKNTDEFFMKRVGGLKQQIEAGVTEETPDGRTPQGQWEEVLDTARPLFEQQASCWETELRPALAAAGVAVHEFDDLSQSQREALRSYFEESIQPTLTPLAFDPAHPFPFISNLSLSLAVLSESAVDDDVTFTRIKVPQNQPRLVEIPGETTGYLLLEDLIEANIDLLLPNIDILDVSKFRVTRNAEVRRNEEVAEDLIDMIEEVIEQRRFATVVRLEVAEDMPDESLDILKEQLKLSDREVFRRAGPIDYRDFFDLVDIDRPDLKTSDWTPQPHPRLVKATGKYDSAGGVDGIFEEIRRGDILAHHPYHSFEGTVQRFLDAAANDPDVLAVKAAIYRTASDSKVIQSLIDAADNGKQVAVMVELKARFDEQNNLEWVRKLEEEGIHAAYGTVGLKTHTKTALVVRREDDGVKLYSHVGTGNYHSETAKGYVDLGILTTDRDVGQDLTKVFNFFTGPTLDEQFRKLLIAPVNLRERFTECIRREAAHARAGRPARIVVKINGLEDPAIVRELYEASIAGVEIDLIVRDICRLRPGLDGISDTVRVHSVVGRFLEHSRIFYFRNGGDPEWYTGSADWMTRNLDYRVEAVMPVESRDIREQLRFVLETSLSDNRRRWVMQSDGTYEQVRPADDESVRDTQETLMSMTMAARSRELERGIAVGDADAGHELLVEPVTDPAEAPRESGGVTEEFESGGHSPSDGGSTGGPVFRGVGTAESPGSVDDGDAVPEVDVERIMERYSEHWYVPDSDQHGWAVRTGDGERRYFRTREGAASRLVEEYE
ncbi:polyphosphate kinase 1 [Haloarchaeobius sp. TZWWS8]|uniref:polyphosphate kinase 1 n=1 Tax=Haloarchaeobius sp. TZWWS8 TaxID=3446121 RepID=UPI003EBE935A